MSGFSLRFLRRFRFWFQYRSGLFIVALIAAPVCAQGMALAGDAAKPAAFSWRLDNVEIRTVIKHMATLTGKQYIVDARVQGKVTLYAEQAESVAEIEQCFLSMLNVMGYTTQTQGHQVQVIPQTGASRLARFAADAALGIEIIPLQHARLASVIDAITPMVPEWAGVSGFTDNNHVLVAADEATRTLVRALIARLDVPQERARAYLQAYALSHVRVQTLLPLLQASVDKNRVHLLAGISQNQLMALAEAPGHARVASLVEALDKPSAQVLVQALIAQVDSRALTQMGVNWQQLVSATSQGALPLARLLQPSRSASTVRTFAEWVGVMHYLAARDRAHILAQPALLILNQHTAQIEVGQRVSVPSTTAATAVPSAGVAAHTAMTTYARENVSLLLAVTPTVINAGQIELAIKHHNNSLHNPANPGLMPLVNVSQLQTAVRVNDGQMVVLGGMAQHSRSRRIRKIPLLGNLPVIGRIFSYREAASAHKILLIMLKPTIVGATT